MLNNVSVTQHRQEKKIQYIYLLKINHSNPIQNLPQCSFWIPAGKTIQMLTFKIQYWNSPVSSSITKMTNFPLVTLDSLLLGFCTWKFSKIHTAGSTSLTNPFLEPDILSVSKYCEPKQTFWKLSHLLSLWSDKHVTRARYIIRLHPLKTSFKWWKSTEFCSLFILSYALSTVSNEPPLTEICLQSKTHSNFLSFHWCVQNAMIPCHSQELLPFLSVVHFFLPPFSTNYSSIISHLNLPSIS